MSEQFTSTDAATESTKNYREYRDAYSMRDRATREKEAADSLARTLFKQLLMRQELGISGIPASNEDRQAAQRKLKKADAAQDTAAKEQFNATIADMDVRNAVDTGARNYAAHPTEYHTAALEAATAAQVDIRQ